MTEWLLVAAALAAGAAVFHKVRGRPTLPVPRLAGSGDFSIEAVSDERQRDALRTISVEAAHGTADVDHLAVLRPAPSNGSDPTAIRVDVAGKAVGHLPADMAALVRPVMRHRAVACAGRIVRAGSGDDDRVSLALDIALPPALAR